MQPRHKFYAELRQSIGTVREVATLLGVHVRTIKRREAGECDITDEMVAALEFFQPDCKHNVPLAKEAYQNFINQISRKYFPGKEPPKVIWEEK